MVFLHLRELHFMEICYTLEELQSFFSWVDFFKGFRKLLPWIVSSFISSTSHLEIDTALGWGMNWIWGQGSELCLLTCETLGKYLTSLAKQLQEPRFNSNPSWLISVTNHGTQVPFLKRKLSYTTANSRKGERWSDELPGYNLVTVS